MMGIGARSVGVVGALAGLLLAGCGSDGGGSADVSAVAPEDFAPTPQYLAQVADRSAAESYRFEMWLTMGDSEPAGPPMVRAAVDGERFSQTVDQGAGMEAMIASLAEEFGPSVTMPPDVAADLRIESIMDGDVTHLRMPHLLEAPDHRLDEQTQELRKLVQETDGWMTVLPSQALGTSPQEYEQMVGGSNPVEQDPGAMVEVITEAEEVSELGTHEVRGVDVVGVEAEIGFADLIEAAGTDPDQFMETFVSSLTEGMGAHQGIPSSEMDRFSEAMGDVMGDLTMPTEVWIDGDGYLRRVTYSIDQEPLISAFADRLGEDAPAPGSLGPQLRTTTDIFDYGEDVAITAPENTVDLTSRPELFDYWELVQLADGT